MLQDVEDAQAAVAAVQTLVLVDVRVLAEVIVHLAAVVVLVVVQVARIHV